MTCDTTTSILLLGVDHILEKCYKSDRKGLSLDANVKGEIVATQN